MENLTFYEPSACQLSKFHHINSWSEEDWELRCISYDDCSICPIAIHQWLLSTVAHHCTYGMNEEKFRLIMMDADCEY